jgi:hypothetical protein
MFCTLPWGYTQAMRLFRGVVFWLALLPLGLAALSLAVGARDFHRWRQADEEVRGIWETGDTAERPRPALMLKVAGVFGAIGGALMVTSMALRRKGASR